jgi:hypothetical protein
VEAIAPSLLAKLLETQSFLTRNVHGVSKNRFTNAMSWFQLGPQVPYRDIFKHAVLQSLNLDMAEGSPVTWFSPYVE